MNTDIRLAVGFWQHPKVHRLEKRLGLKGVRSLQILWCWCAQNRPNGRLDGLDSEDIEFVADWRGKKGAFFEQCLGSWIDETESGYLLHEWHEHNPWQAANGERLEAKREQCRQAAMSRWSKEKKQSDSDECENNTDAMRTQCAENANAYATAMQVQCENNTDAMRTQCAENANAYATAMQVQCENNTDAMRAHMPPIPIPEDIKILNTPPHPPEGGECVGQSSDASQNSVDMSEQSEKPEKGNHRKREPTGDTVPELEAAIDAHTSNPTLRKTLKEFRKMRERIRKPLIGSALVLIFGKLQKLAPDNDALKTAILEQSILNSWQGVFPLEHTARASPGTNRPKTFAELEEERRQAIYASARAYDEQKEREAREGKSA